MEFSSKLQAPKAISFLSGAYKEGFSEPTHYPTQQTTEVYPMHWKSTSRETHSPKRETLWWQETLEIIIPSHYTHLINLIN